MNMMNMNRIILIGLLAFMAVNNGLLTDPVGWLSRILLIIPGIVIGLSFHEFAHAIVAYKLGDNTPKFQERLTVNPMAHIDPVGLVALLFVGFGWGKPVQVNPAVFKNRRRDEALVSIAGVTMNLILAVIFTVVLAGMVQFGSAFIMTDLGNIIFDIIVNIIQINIVLMVFNLLPIPPLDGFNLIGEIFNLKKYPGYWKIYDYGMFILLGAILLGLTSRVLVPIVSAIMNFLLGFVPF